MAHYVLSAEAAFAAAHTLPGVDMCARMHGHNWRVQVSIKVTDLDGNGMGLDFRDLERITQESVQDFEHQYLNDLAAFDDRLPTAEGIARLVCERVAGRLMDVAPGVQVDEVTLWEMPQYRVVYRPT